MPDHPADPADQPEDIAMLRAALLAAEARIAMLEQMIHAIRRARFGQSAERIDTAQLALMLGQEPPPPPANDPSAISAAAARGTQPRQRNRGALPAHLERVEHVLDVADKNCHCCKRPMHLIGEDRTERLDVVPAQLRVRVTIRPRYACRGCADGVHQRPAPDHAIPGGLPTEALLAHVLMAKYGDGLPLYRQAAMLSRQGIELDRSTLCDWVAKACWWLRPLHALILAHVTRQGRVFADDTPLPTLEHFQAKRNTWRLGKCDQTPNGSMSATPMRGRHAPERGRRRTRIGRLWAYAVDDRPWQGGTLPAVAYVYSSNRRAEHPGAHLAGFRGMLQVDGYGGFKALRRDRDDGAVVLAFCWAHLRRRFFDIHAATQSPIAAEALLRIAALYAIEAGIRGSTAEQRLAVRQAQSAPLVAELEAWFHAQLNRLSHGSKLAEAIRYGLRHWQGLSEFLSDGRLEMDTNTVEREIRPVAVTRKAALFAGSEGGGENWAIAITLIRTAILNGVDPQAWMADVLEQMVSGKVNSRSLASLLPWAWRDAKRDAVAA
jgi:transposase